MRDPSPHALSTRSQNRSLLLLLISELTGQMESSRRFRDQAEARFLALEGRLSAIETRILMQAWSTMDPRPDFPAPPMSMGLMGYARKGLTWLKQNLSFLMAVYKIWRAVPWTPLVIGLGALWALVGPWVRGAWLLAWRWLGGA